VKKKETAEATAVSFTESSQQLGRIIERFRTEALTLEDSLSLFEEGVQHLKVCQQKLASSRGRVEELVKTLTDDGTVQTREFEASAADDGPMSGPVGQPLAPTAVVASSASMTVIESTATPTPVSKSRLVPELHRCRLLIEGLYRREFVRKDDVTEFLFMLVDQLGLRLNANPIVYKRLDENVPPALAGYEAVMPLLSGAVHFAVWPREKLVAVLWSGVPEHIDTEMVVDLAAEFFEMETYEVRTLA
jgi:exodeoxyribonuclease VII small subunit